MQSRYLKQVAHNDRIIQAEKEVAAINADIPDFLCEMTLDPTDQVVIVVNGSEEMKRDEEAFAGQLWMQSDRHMTAANPPLFGDNRSREGAILSAIVEATTWKHALEDMIPGLRQGQRVIIYPKELTGLPQVLASRNIIIPDEEDHSELYSAILQASDSFERPPLFLREDCDQITSHPVWSVEVPKWMITAARVATGSRRRVLENGPDTMNSGDEDAVTEEHGDELSGMYAPGCVSLDDARLTEEQAQKQRAAASSQATSQATSQAATKEPRVPPRSRSPAYSSSYDDTLDGPEHIWSQTKGVYRRNKAWIRKLAESALALPAPEPEPAKPPYAERV
jgi:hypothetical protein